MGYGIFGGFPSQQLSFKSKTSKWRKQCVDFGDNHSALYHNATRKSDYAMAINYDLLEGKIHMEDLKMVVNPYKLDASFIPDSIQHYPIMNSKLNVLKGEESERVFDFRAIVTNPNAISEMEEEKNKIVNERLQQLIADTSQDEEDFQAELEKLSDYFTFEYQDKREVRANRVLNHYSREQEFPQMFNRGFTDAYTVSEEAYQCDIVGGEPIMEKLNPRTMRILRSGTSNKIEDADMIIIEEYKNPGWVVDVYGPQLTKKQIDKIESGGHYNADSGTVDSMDNFTANDNNPIIPLFSDWQAGDKLMSTNGLFDETTNASLLPFDINGNVRVLKVYWKSRRRIKKVKWYDPETGEEQFTFRDENYVLRKELGEEEEGFWINEAWEGVKIADDIYVNMGPRPIQYNRLSNPSKCHFGIVGSIYNINGDQPLSLVDMVKPYAYLYDVIHDRLNKTLAKNVGKVVRMDFAKVPKDWDVDKWLYYINVNGVAVEDSFKEGEYGRATGVMAGAMNNNSNGVIDASLSNEIQQYISLLEWIANKIGEIIGISKQREGQISNRETVGGVERATLQSSHITKWIFFEHDSVKKRALECFLETAKIAFKGRKVKFDYILANGAKETVEFDGDEFAECDYGLVVDNSNGTQELNQKLDTLAQAALQNQLLDFSTIMRLYTSTSVAEKQRIVEANEKRKLQQAQQQQQHEMEMHQQELQQQAQIEEAKMQQEYTMHQEDNETKILVAQINSQAEADRLALMNEENGITRQEEMDFKKQQLDLDNKQFNAKLDFDKIKHQDDVSLKKRQIAKTSSNKK